GEGGGRGEEERGEVGWGAATEKVEKGKGVEVTGVRQEKGVREVVGKVRRGKVVEKRLNGGGKMETGRVEGRA
ncbi:hypothetical protein, partial [Kocuria rhizophila]|uniref:hypothetical protein n=1 Tax=Kocuria rhizophila TaxID=72000 RepID=UPI001C92CE2A